MANYISWPSSLGNCTYYPKPSSNNNEDFRKRIAAKASVSFLRQIDSYIEVLEQDSFKAVEWRTGRKIVPDWFFAETWPKHRGVNLTDRINRMLKAAESQIGFYYNYDLRVDERQSLREAIRGMVRKITLRQAYQSLFDWLGKPEWFKPVAGKLEYADVFPLIYFKMRLEGLKNPYAGIKHLLIDEMQDYTTVQYAVLGRLFSCKKTVLGDAGQSVNPYTRSTAENISESLQASISVELNKSYRSTWEIMQFALGIVPNPQLQAMERHGEVPGIIQVKRQADMLQNIQQAIVDFQDSSHSSLAIICKTQKMATALYKSLLEGNTDMHLLDTGSQYFSTGVLICTAHLAKGLEFDRVIIANASAKNYHNEMDRNLLYVACTRAMHRLSLFSVGEVSPLLNTLSSIEQ